MSSMADWKMAEDLLKAGILTKRAQNKKSIGRTNYKERLFVLTETTLQYFDGTIKQKGKLKGSIPVSNINFVGPITDEALKRTSTFQVVHNGYYLYICAKSEVDRDQWIEAIMKACTARLCKLNSLYHASLFSNGKWQCCGNIDKNLIGCRVMENAVVHDSQCKGRVPAANDIPPELPPRLQNQMVEIDVVAIHNFAPQEPGDMPLYAGDHYTIINNRRQHWWKARDSYGNEGYIPSNYVRDRQVDEIETKDWYQPAISRMDAEKCLMEDQAEGSFLVRSSTLQDRCTLSVVSKYVRATGKAVVMHYHIKQNEDGEYYLAEKHACPSILDLIHFHQLNAGGLVTRLRHAPAKYRTSPPAALMFSDTQWDIDFAELKFEKLLGSGQFGNVKLALFRNEQYVAVKMMQEGAMEEDSFIEEAQVMTRLNHRNLVHLYGVVTRQRPICIVMEYAENGCLLDYIRTYASELSEDVLLNMCYQVCDAMCFLEESSFIHRDLAARNCLIGRKMVVKVSDFGLTRFVVDDEYTSSAGSKFPIKWAAPEVLNFSRFSSKSDVWAFGILMWEIFSGGEMPYFGIGNKYVIIRIADGYRLERPKYCSQDVYSLMRQTWESEPESRPSFCQLMHAFHEAMDK